MLKAHAVYSYRNGSNSQKQVPQDLRNTLDVLLSTYTDQVEMVVLKEHLHGSRSGIECGDCS